METDGNKFNVVWILIICPILCDSVPNIRGGVMLSELHGWLGQTTDRKALLGHLQPFRELNRFCSQVNRHITNLNWEKRVSNMLDHCQGLFNAPLPFPIWKLSCAF